MTDTTPADERNDLRSDIKHALNRASAENGSDTPDHVLADYLLACLDAFDAATKARSSWYGHHQTILSTPGLLTNACACGDCYHPAFGPNTDGEPCDWCQDCACASADHFAKPCEVGCVALGDHRGSGCVTLAEGFFGLPHRAAQSSTASRAQVPQTHRTAPRSAEQGSDGGKPSPWAWHERPHEVREDLNDASMCLCGLPADDSHDAILAKGGQA